MSAHGAVARILFSSAVDGPGNRAVVFLQGCDFNCAWCHNPETLHACRACGVCIAACPHGALEASIANKNAPPVWHPERCKNCGACIAACPHESSPKVLDLDCLTVLEKILRYRPFLRGITVSGGECLLQKDYVTELCTRGRAAGLPVLVDTNGSTPLEALPDLVAAAEGFMLDVKVWNAETHRRLTGAENRTVLANLNFLASNGKLDEVRTVVVPGLFDATETVREVSTVLRNSQSTARYKLIRYRPAGVRPGRVSSEIPSDALMHELAELAVSSGAPTVVIV